MLTGGWLRQTPTARQALRKRFGRLPEHINEVFGPDALEAVTKERPQLLRWGGDDGELHVRLSAPRRQHPIRAVPTEESAAA